MAIFKPGPIIGGISGNLSASNFVNAKGTPVIRRRTTRTNRATQAQLAQRATLASFASFWHALDDEQRLTWNVGARERSFTNTLGLPYTLNGFQLFVKYNMNIALLEDPIQVEPLLLNQTQPPKTVTLNFTLLEGATYLVSWTLHTVSIPTIFTIYGSRPVTKTPTKTFYNWRLISITKPTMSFLDLAPAWIPILGRMAIFEVFALEIVLTQSGKLPSPRFRIPGSVVPL